VLSGSVKVGERSHVGAGAVLIQGVSVGSDCTIGAGAVVIADIPAGTTAVGVPAQAKE
jgi:acetyltransferase-like isoleucine patch superfamily enzyme